MQSMPELKRDGSNILSSVQCELFYDDISTTRANSILAQAEAIPKLIQRLKDHPDEVQKDFESLRNFSTPLTLSALRKGYNCCFHSDESVWNAFLCRR